MYLQCTYNALILISEVAYKFYTGLIGFLLFFRQLDLKRVFCSLGFSCYAGVSTWTTAMTFPSKEEGINFERKCCKH